jgi:hypothetical protein
LKTFSPGREYLRLFRKLNLYVVAYSFVPPVVGMIAAVVLYLVFAAGLLEGGLFPAFACPATKNCTDYGGFVADWCPKDAAENAKAIVNVR